VTTAERTLPDKDNLGPFPIALIHCQPWRKRQPLDLQGTKQLVPKCPLLGGFTVSTIVLTSPDEEERTLITQKCTIGGTFLRLFQLFNSPHL